MFACYWTAIAPNGRSYVYREYCAPNLIVSEAAQEILNHTIPGEMITMTFAPPDMWNRSKESGKTAAETFMLAGVPIVRADNNRVQGHLQIKEMLSDMGDGKPEFMVFNTCRQLIDDIQAIQADEKNPNDCAKQPHDITHSVDGIRYFCVSRKMITELQGEEPDEFEDEDKEDYDEVMTGGEISESYMSY